MSACIENLCKDCYFSPVAEESLPSFYEDGARVAPTEATASRGGRALLYGESLFETMRAYRGRIFELDSHLARLAEGASLLEFELSATSSELKSELEGALVESGLGDAALRLTLVREGGAPGLSYGGLRRARRLLTIAPLTLPSVEVYASGIAVTLESVERHSSMSKAPAKWGNYLPNIVALATAERKGSSDAILVSLDGYPLSGSTSNLFCVHEGELITPPLAGGILSGVTRSAVLRLAEQLGIVAKERWLTVDELNRASEVFLTSSLRELMPVASIGGQRVGAKGFGGDQSSWPVTNQLRAAFSALTTGLTP